MAKEPTKCKAKNSTPIPPAPKRKGRFADQDRGAYSIDEFCDWAGISRFRYFKEWHDFKIFPKKSGARTIIPVAEAQRWLCDLPEAEKPRQPSATMV